MSALIKIFSGAVDLLAKARRDHSALVKALERKDLIATKDAVFNFSVSAYHIIDWLNRYNPDLTDKTNSLRGKQSIKIIRDICNASKHVELDLNSSAYKKYPQVVTAVDVSLTSQVSLPCPGSWVLKVSMGNHNKKRFEDIANTVIDDLEQFFRENGMHADNTVETTNSGSLD